MLFVIPEKKVAKLKGILQGLSTDFPNLRVRSVASVCGFIISLSPALGPITRLLTRQMYAFIQTRVSWNDILHASIGVGEEIKFWLQHVDAFNGYSVNRCLSFSAVLYCDASGSGYGASSDVGDNRNFCSGMWNDCDRYASSCFRELKAVFLALRSFL